MMEIKGLDYNTQRAKLQLPEYGREVQKMVEYAVALPDKAERLACAKAIVKLMAGRNPQGKSSENYEQTLWDHLYIMSDRKLDIDWPYDVTVAEHFLAKPEPMPYQNGQFRMRHYGKLLNETFEKLKTMEPGQERDELVKLTANQMKRDLVVWGHGSTDDEKVADDLARLTDGVIQLDLNNFRFNPVEVDEPTGKRQGKRKR